MRGEDGLRALWSEVQREARLPKDWINSDYRAGLHTWVVSDQERRLITIHQRWGASESQEEHVVILAAEEINRLMEIVLARFGGNAK